MEVMAPDPEISAEVLGALISYAEEQVDHLTQRLRDDQMQGARDSYDDAEAKMKAAQQKVLELQEKVGVLDPASENASLMSQITGFETQLAEAAALPAAARGQPAAERRRGSRGQRATSPGSRPWSQGCARSRPPKATPVNRSPKISSDLRVAQSDLQTRQMMMQQALQQLETARIEANQQVRYLSMGVSPVAAGRGHLSAEVREYAAGLPDLRRHLPDDFADRLDPARTGLGLSADTATTPPRAVDRGQASRPATTARWR